jgi:hypothetical protein
MTVSIEPAETDVAQAIEREIQTWLAQAPSQLGTDAARPIEAEADRFSGRFLVYAVRALPGDCDRERVISAAASVECLSAQMRLKDTTALDAADEEQTRALLASDFLHSLAYAGVTPGDPAEAEQSGESIGQACYRSLATASQRLTSCWLQSADAMDSHQNAPIEPIVTATAGELAGLLGRANEQHLDALKSLGVTLGFERWRQRTGQEEYEPDDADSECPWLDQALPNRFTSAAARDWLSVLPESPERSALGRFIDSVFKPTNREVSEA